MAGPLSVHAAAVAFQNPATATWGNWARNSPSTVHVAYDVFANPAGFGVSPVLPDSTPDKAAFGVKATNGALLLTKKKNSSATPAAFITGSGNIYSFADVLDFDLILQPGSSHTSNLTGKPVTVALQLSILGSDLDFNSVKLLGQKWETKTLLSSGAAAGPGGTGTGVDNEYLFLWHLSSALAVYTFDFAARESSLSLDALTVDIGPTRVVAPPIVVPPVVTPPITTVPLPPALPGLLGAIALLALRRRAA